MSHAPLRFLFDYISPYSYLAWTQLHALAERQGRTVEPVPVLLGGILKALGTRGPAEVPAKRLYVYKQTYRIAHGLGVPFAVPPSHPFNPLLALRVTVAVEEPEARRRLISALYAGAWGGRGGVESAEQVSALASSAGLDGPRLLAAAQGTEVKDRLRRNTEEAIAAGVFGVPTVLVDGELFFGVDSLGHLEQFLRGEDPLTPAEVERMRSLPISAHRS